MKKNILIFILVALLTAVAALLSSCESATAAESMSLKPSAEMESSSSMDELSSSSMEELSSSSAGNSSSSFAYYYGETGKVCKAWTVKDVSASQAYDEYLSMIHTCGDQKALDNEYNLGEVLFNWLIRAAGVDDSTAAIVADDVERYGSSLHYYQVDDGSLNYIYVEPFMDGAGLK